jgi:phosphocarrier protein HPr
VLRHPNLSSQRCRSQTSQIRVVRVTDPLGLHLRRCLAVVNAVRKHEAQVRVVGNGQIVDAASILGLLSLAAIPGTELVLSAKGPTADEALEDIANVFADIPAADIC